MKKAAYKEKTRDHIYTHLCTELVTFIFTITIFYFLLSKILIVQDYVVEPHIHLFIYLLNICFLSWWDDDGCDLESYSHMIMLRICIKHKTLILSGMQLNTVDNEPQIPEIIIWSHENHDKLGNLQRAKTEDVTRF